VTGTNEVTIFGTTFGNFNMLASMLASRAGSGPHQFKVFETVSKQAHTAMHGQKTRKLRKMVVASPPDSTTQSNALTVLRQLDP
jgi:hypothetical protein